MNSTHHMATLDFCEDSSGIKIMLLIQQLHLIYTLLRRWQCQVDQVVILTIKDVTILRPDSDQLLDIRNKITF